SSGPPAPAVWARAKFRRSPRGGTCPDSPRRNSDRWPRVGGRLGAFGRAYDPEHAERGATCVWHSAHSTSVPLGTSLYKLRTHDFLVRAENGRGTPRSGRSKRRRPSFVSSRGTSSSSWSRPEWSSCRPFLQRCRR